MQIYIPTYGRANRQRAWDRLPEKLKLRTLLVVQHRERKLYDKYPTLVLPPKIQTIAPTRQWIANRHRDDKFVMLDDDVYFDARREDDMGKFCHANDKSVIELFKVIEKKLDSYAHVGVLTREGGNRITNLDGVENMRMMRVLAYNAKTLWRENIKWDRLPLQEDFDVTLQLLRKGYPNFVITRWVNGQGASGTSAKGGCEHFRTLELHNANAIKLAALHDPFVKIVEKTTKSSWGGQKRLDVMVSWKKAYAEGVANRAH
jgi:hypothetical protein